MHQRQSHRPVVLLMVLTLALFLGMNLHAQAAKEGQCGLTLPIDNGVTVPLPGNIPALARPANDFGAADPAMPMQHMILTLKISPEKRAKLDRLLVKQQDPASPLYHHWLTPQQFGRRFGPSRADLAVVKHWLRSEGFSIDKVANGRMWINFSGMTSDVERAFHTQIHNYLVHGVVYDSNATDISIPSVLAPVVAGVVSLNSFPLKPMNTGFHKLSPADAAAVAAKTGGIQADWSGTANGSNGVYTSPIDWATIYDANASYSANGNGSGVTIGIVGRTNPGTSNWATFRSVLGLPANTPTIIVNGTNPGDLGAGEDGEADLDAEWSGGVAPGATVKFVASKSTSSTDGVDLSAQYIVDNNIADVMSTSFGQCESSMGSSENNFYNNLWSQAASQGITSCVSTGDSGPAGCAGGSASSGSGQSGVNGLASTPYDIAVGATQLSTSSSYWNGSGAAISYIPETPWNESGTVSGGSGLWSTSSGASNTYSKPSWQSAPGVPSASHRYLPDVCLDGSDMFFGNYGMLVYTQGSMATTGGTSAASPSFAGVMALIVQKYGRQGNANTVLYQLGTAQYGSSGPAVFHDITSGNNNVPGLTGYTATTAWDEVTGLGTVDVDALVNNWSGAASTYSISGTITYNGSGLSGVSVTAGSVSATTNASGAYTINGVANGTYTVTPSLSGYTFSPASQSVTVNSANVTGINFTASGGTVTYSISGTITAGGSSLSGVTVSTGSASATTNSSGTYTISGLGNGTYTVTPSLSGYTFSPASQSVTINGANKTGINFAGTASGGGCNAQTATYSSTYHCPAATTAGKSVTAPSSLLQCSGNNEANSPNTIDGCADGTSGTCHSDESIEAITIATTDGTSCLAPGRQVTVTVDTYCWGTADYVTFFYATDASNPTWTKVGSTQQAPGSGSHSFTWTFTLSGTAGTMQAVRAQMTYNHDPGTAACYSGSYNDRDDLAFMTSGTAPTTYGISGTITSGGSGLSGVTVSTNGTTATTNSSGAYTLSGLVNGTYTVTPSLNGYTFSPASQSVTINGANKTGINFTATVIPPSTYNISGTITSGGSGLSGVTVTAGSASATTNGSGAYTLSGLVNGSYTVAPSLSGYTFTPASASEMVNGANITGVNFTAASASGTGIANGGFETGSLSGWSTSGAVTPAASTVQKHSGSYSAYLAGSVNGSATDSILYQNVTVPAGGGTLSFWYYPVSPDSITYDWQQVDICNTSGTVLANVMKVCSNTKAWTNKTLDLSSYAGQTIQIRFTDHDDGYSGDQTNMYVDDVTVIPPAATYSISGTITYNGSGLSGVTVTAGSASATTAGSGAYTITGVTDGTYTVLPTLAGYAFTPASASETVNGANVSGVNFTAAVSAGPTTLFSDGFESGGWSTAQVSGSQGAWSMVSSGPHPSASPHGGSTLADFNSWTSHNGNETRLYRTQGFAISNSYSTATLSFWMYHETGYSSDNDRVQVQVSTNGTTWTNVGSAVSRYNGSTGWAQATVDLSAYKGQTVYLAFVGISAYGNDCYIDDVSVVGQ